ncbi:DNA phosphorothioation system sulfurtransferase DndC [Motiliproteus sediminis]|uniref:DNA phosphorothioation system sulfurtransferase DndC n=1 Tax=Motiliproteus sediminis TaxID=1468178 RepID=UPI001AEF62A6|nr:DNA phosphorothioation system sulfurtransferase DndC [Motiliproteus sediminis]
MKTENNSRYSAFNELGLKASIDALVAKTQEIYLSDDIPWVLGYSGGKDSTAILQIVWRAIEELAQQGKAHKTVHIISTDTLVENPVVSLWVQKSIELMQQTVKARDLPLAPQMLKPEIKDRFWVNLVGRGYPSPRNKFRWCTPRLKIAPSNNFIRNVVKQNGEAILVLGTRKAESSTRSANMSKYEDSTRANLSRNKELDRVWVYTPIGDWTDDDVWMYLMQNKNPWGLTNNDLLGMYQGATDGGECPLVVDSSTQSCGDSRFGCYVCTMVGEDKSLAAMIQNDEEKEWMEPLLHIKSLIDVNDTDPKERVKKLQADKEKRDFRRMTGSLTVHVSDKSGAGLVHGPYKQSFREQLLEEILRAQMQLQQNGPDQVRGWELIEIAELEEIRRIWVSEKHEVEDHLPAIYERVTGQDYPGAKHHKSPIFNTEDMALLKSLCPSEDKHQVLFQTVRELLHIEYQHRSSLKRSKLLENIDEALERGAFENAEDATEFALVREKERKRLKKNRVANDPKAIALLDHEIQLIDSRLDELKRNREKLIDIVEVA